MLWLNVLLGGKGGAGRGGGCIGIGHDGDKRKVGWHFGIEGGHVRHSADGWIDGWMDGFEVGMIKILERERRQ